MRLEDVENLRQVRLNAEAALEQKKIDVLIESAIRQSIGIPQLKESEQFIAKVRTELVDYIIEHGLVQGFEWMGYDRPIQSGKIVITQDMIKDAVDLFFVTPDQLTKFVSEYLTENNYVSDSDYVHTDNNFTDGDVIKLSGIEEGSEVNRVDDVTLDGKSVLDIASKVAEITSEDIKASYESNEDTNAFTDADLVKLQGIEPGADVNRVENVTLNGTSVLNPNTKIAAISAIEDVSATFAQEETSGDPFGKITYTFNKKKGALTTPYATPGFANFDQLLSWAKTMRNDHDNLGDQVQTQQADINTLKQEVTETSGEVASLGTDLGKLGGGQPGQYLKKKTGSSFDVEWSDIEAGVSDVQVDGVSVVTDGIANIPSSDVSALFSTNNDFVGTATYNLFVNSSYIYVRITRFSEFMAFAQLELIHSKLDQENLQFTNAGSNIIPSDKSGVPNPRSMSPIFDMKGNKYVVSSNYMIFYVGSFTVYKNADFSGESFCVPIRLVFNQSGDTLNGISCPLPSDTGIVEAATIQGGWCLIPLRKVASISTASEPAAMNDDLEVNETTAKTTKKRASRSKKTKTEE